MKIGREVPGLREVSVVFEPFGRRTPISAGTTILKAARQSGIRISSECGGRGLCGRCRVSISDHGACEAPTSAEVKLLGKGEIERGFRLACQAKIENDVVVVIPKESVEGERKFQAVGLERGFSFDPFVRKHHLPIPEYYLKTRKISSEDLLRIAEENHVEALGFSPWALDHIPASSKSLDEGVTLTLWDDRIIDVEPGDTERRIYGAALDIGTSKIVGHLVDLTEGRTLAVASVDNPQDIHGDDVMSRITFALKAPGNLEELHVLSLRAVNRVLRTLFSEASVDAKEVFGAVAVGNTLMHHLFLGLEVRPLAYAPFDPVVKSSVNSVAAELGTSIHPAGIVHLPPLIAGFVGSDAVADLLTTGISDSREPAMLVDIGTNTEVFAGDLTGLVACSCASGPAFEGAHISHGMKAVSGAIERVRIDPETLEVEYDTIGGGEPIGVCGSAMIDALAEMWKCGLVDGLGRLRLDAETARMRGSVLVGEFVLEWGGSTGTNQDITITQGDIEELLLAKAAIHAACSIMLKRRGLEAEEVTKVYVAGAFGGSIDPENAVVLGMFPDIRPERFVFVGNTAVTGAKAMLVSREARETAERLPDMVAYHELSLDPEFDKEFLNSIFVPHKDLGRFPTAQRLVKKHTP